MSSSRRPLALTAWVSLVLVFALAAAALAAEAAIPLDRNGLPQWEIKIWEDVPVRIELRDISEVETMLDRVPLAAFDREDLTIVWDTPKMHHVLIDVRATEAEIEALAAAGYRPVMMPDLERAAREETERVWAERAAEGLSATRTKADPYDYYPTHAEIGTILDGVAATYPTLARTFQWGSSVQGRELWGIVISDDVTSSEAEPEVRISSTMHGDEVVPMVMALNLVHYLTDNYGVTGYEDVTNLVDNYEIHIMPLHNPDGMVLDQRYNANGVDLNRNFDLPDGTHAYMEVENIHFQDYGLANHFVISQNGHGGALVVNYPWDYTYTLAPDNDALIKLSLEYSTYNLPMYNGSFDQGITNGAAWYVTQGCVQDWSYDQTDCIDVTLEQSNTKWPAASTLEGFWDDNRESYMHWIKAARYGVNGIVTGSDSGLPLDATIEVVGIDMPVHTDPSFGDYYKLLDTGTYDITFSADGYITQTVYGVSTVWGTPTVLDVTLDPVAHGEITGYVFETGGVPIDADIDVYTHPGNEYVAVSTSAATSGGAYTVTNLIYGDYHVVYSADFHITDDQIVTLDASSVAAPDMTLGIAEAVTLFADDGESGVGQWSGTWAQDAPGHDGSYGISDSPGDEYGHYEDKPCAIATPLDLSDIMSGTVGYWCKWDIEADWDGVQFQVSTDGGANWTPLASSRTEPGSGQGAQVEDEPYYHGAQATWVYEEHDLAPWLGGADVRFRFHLVSDSSVEEDGFHFDDFLVEGLREYDPGTGVGDLTPVVTRLQGAYPNPFNPSTRIAFSTARAGHASLAVYDLTGRLVRTLVDGHLGAGEHTALWNGLADDGARAASGVYFARFAGGDVVDTTKLMLVK